VNAGVVANKGWEFSASLKVNDHFSVQASFSEMKSIIEDTSGFGHSSGPDNQVPGSQLNNIPRHTAGLFMTYTCPRVPALKGRMDISFNVTEVDGTVAYDAKGIEVDVAYGRLDETVPNYDLPYWKKSGMIIQLGLNVDYYIKNDLRFFIQGSNIANNNQFEDGSSYPTHGAAWMFGFKYNMLH
jgi:outer membrane receptor protein involved in Fe transport